MTSILGWMARVQLIFFMGKRRFPQAWLISKEERAAIPRMIELRDLLVPLSNFAYEQWKKHQSDHRWHSIASALVTAGASLQNDVLVLGPLVLEAIEPYFLYRELLVQEDCEFLQQNSPEYLINILEEARVKETQIKQSLHS